MAFIVPSHQVCPFCENVAGREVTSRDGSIVPCAVVEQLERTFAFLSPRQIGKPHILVIPARHAATIVDLTSEEVVAIGRHTQLLASAVSRAFEPTGMNIYQNNGIGAGQSVGHCHVHIVLRYGDGRDSDVLSTRELPRTPFDELLDLVSRVRSALNEVKAELLHAS